MASIKKVAILGGSRIPFARSGTAYQKQSNLELMSASLNALVKRMHLEGLVIDDVALGAVIKHARDFNLARETVLNSQLNWATPGVDMQRACGTSLETSIHIANKIALGQIQVGIAGGTDTNSDVPLEFSDRFSQRIVQSSRARSLKEILKTWKGVRFKELKPIIPQVVEPRTGLSMGEHCELMAQEWQITQEEQDALSLESHKNAVAAYERGFYSDLVAPFSGLQRDNNLRPDTSIEKLSKLKPAFETSEKGTMTAGNSTPLTDGSSAVLFSSEKWASQKDIPVQAYLSYSQVAAVNFVAGEGLLMGPTKAVANLLKHQKLTLQDFDFYEIHEAFAAQVLCTLKAWESPQFCKDKLGLKEPLGSIDRKKLNVAGGSVGIGHPFAATGTRLIANAAKLLQEKGSGRALLSACTAGGMGVAAIVEK